MAATNLQMNWTSGTFNSTAITKITSVTIEYGGKLISFSGDSDKYATTIVNNMNSPKVTIKTGNPAGLQAFTIGQTGAIAITHSDAKAGVNGAIAYTINNAVVENISTGGQHAQFGEGTITFECFSSDGTTSPISFTRA